MKRTNESSLALINEKIEKAKNDVATAKKRYDNATAALKQLMDKRDALEKDLLLKAVAKSDRTYEEIMAYLNGDSDDEEDE